MTGARHATWIILLITACFHPSYDHPTCGPNGECPNGLTCSTQGICDAQGGSVGPTADAQSGDGQDGQSSDAAATDCFGHWLDGSVAISGLQEFASLSTAASDRDPWISTDRLTLYFASNRAGTSDIYLASRNSAAQPFRRSDPAPQLAHHRS